jgi:hypothetical protein
MNKLVSFKLYRYHLVPVSTRQVNLFENFMSFDDLKEKKNDYFQEVLLKIENSREERHALDYPIKLIFQEEFIFMFKIAVTRRTTLYHDFEAQDVSNEPFVYVIIDNSRDSQKILIGDNRDAFADTNTVKNILQTIFNFYLYDFFLVMHIEPIIEATDFWKIVELYKDAVERLNFNIVKPNLADISKSLREPLRQLIDNTNSHKTVIHLNAPKSGVLENLSQENEQLNDIVSYSNEGGGEPIKIKIKGIKKMISPKNKIKEIHIELLEVTGDSQKITDVLKDLLK